MTIELVKILEAAKFYNNRSMEMYNYAEKAEQENNREDYEIYWNWCREIDERCKGLLEAYEIMTGKKICTYEIEKELATML